MEHISRIQVEEEKWIRSIGVPLKKEHFRELPPGKRHAVFDLGAPYATMHYDRFNPYASLGDLLNHLWDWSPVGTLALGYAAYRL